MPISLPSSPSVGQIYTYGDKAYKWNGSYWAASPIEYVGYTGTKNSLRLSLLGKGVPVGPDDPLALYPGHIDSISGGTPIPTEPFAFVAGNWILTAGTTSLIINITALPSDGGSVITAIQYSFNGTTWTNLSGTGTGSRTLTGLSATPYNVQLRLQNAVGFSAASDTKTATPTAASGGSALWIAVQNAYGNMGVSPGAGVVGIKPAGTTSTDFLFATVTGVMSTRAPSAPSGWTLLGSELTTFSELSVYYYGAPGSVTAMEFISPGGINVNINVAVHRLSGVDLVTPLRNAITSNNGDTWPAFEVADMPAPAQSATAGDVIISHCCLPQNDQPLTAPTSGFTRALSVTAPNTQSTLYQNITTTGSYGPINHGSSAAYQARVASTIVLRAA